MRAGFKFLPQSGRLVKTQQALPAFIHPCRRFWQGAPFTARHDNLQAGRRAFDFRHFMPFMPSCGRPSRPAEAQCSKFRGCSQENCASGFDLSSWYRRPTTRRAGGCVLIRGDTMRVVICGGGVIGACTAYFLSRRGIDVLVVERTEVAAAASGKSGGFLALDWCAGTPLDALARRSFALHAALPDEIAGDWGYRRMTAYSGFVVPERDARRHVPAELAWLSDGVVIGSQLGTTETTAIVHPRKFTAAMMSAAQGQGAELRRGRITGIVRRADESTIGGVEV